MKTTTLSIASFLSCVNISGGHLFMFQPFTRQYTKTAFFIGNSGSTEYCPHCLQARGVGAVRERAMKNTNPFWLESYGGGNWPLKYLYEDGMVADNGNYLEPKEIAVRHGVCGDPSQGAPEGDNRYGIANSNFQVVGNYSAGSVIEIKTMTSTYHWGHLEYFICDANDLDDPDEPVTQECFNKYPLSRSLDDGAASPIDPAHLGRYFLDPPCRTSETDQIVRPEGDFSGQVSTMHYVLPAGLTCERCILQMIYYTGNSCNHPGYREFIPKSVPMGCAPTKDDWINPANFRDCGDDNAYPEEFWNCADISISSGNGGGSIPTPSSPSPTSSTVMPTSVPMPTEVEPTSTPAIPTPSSSSLSPSTVVPSPVPTPTGVGSTVVPTTPTPSGPSPSPSTVMLTPAPTPIGVKATQIPTQDETVPPIATPAPGEEVMLSPAPQTTPSPVEVGDCVEPYGQQCGGEGWNGATCCTADHECEMMAPCYAQCRRVQAEEKNCKKKWQQCGGIYYQGYKCCEKGSTCV
ncbi:unnamed protein product, partial [Choristocarpus tenellus]